MLDVLVRKANGNDMPFIFGTWKNSYSSRLKMWMPLSAAKDEVGRRIEALIRRGAQFYVAEDTRKADKLYGFVCVKDGYLHYAYTKEIFRRAKVMSRLLSGLVARPVKCSHFTHSLEEIAEAKPGQYIYSPKAAEQWRKK